MAKFAAGTKRFILYDSRARPDGPGDASVLFIANSEEEARRDSESSAGESGLWFEYTAQDDGTFGDERARPDIGAGRMKTRRRG